MASSSERKAPLDVFHHTSSPVFVFAVQDQCVNLILVLPTACDDVVTPGAVADSAVKELKCCLENMPAGRRMQDGLNKSAAMPPFHSSMLVIFSQLDQCVLPRG